MNELDLLQLRKRQLELELELADAEQAQSQPQVEAQPPISQAESFGRGVQQGATLGFADEIGGGVNALLHLGAKVLPYESPYESAQQAYTEGRAEDVAKYKAAEEANPLTYGAGTMAGGIATTAALPVVGGIPGQIAKEAALGAIEGAGTAENLQAVPTQAALGGALGGGLGFVGEIVSALRKLGGIKSEAVANYLAEKAAGLYRTQGQREQMNMAARLSAKAAERAKAAGTEVPESIIQKGDIGRYLREKKLVSLSPETTAENIAAQQAKVGQQIGGIVEQAAPVSRLDIAEKLLQQADQYKGVEGMRGVQKKLGSKADEYIQNAETLGDTIPAKGLAKSKEELQNRIYQNNKLGAPVTSDVKRADMDALQVVKEGLDEAVQPNMLKDYLEAKRAYSMLAPANEAALANVSNLEGKQFFRLGQAVPSTLATQAAGPLAGLAALGANQFVTKSGAAAGSKLAGGVSHVLNSPEALLQRAPAQYQSTLQNALQRGDKSFMITHYLLQQKFPDYRQNALLSDEESADQVQP